MKTKINMYILIVMAGLVLLNGCGGKGSIERVEVKEGDPLVYVPVDGAKASSFDKTPDWAPEPNPMAAVDGDMLTRWSSSYQPGDQWIYLDMCKKVVISNVIIRWERAHSTDYKILASNDAEKWTEVYHQKEATGGSMEAIFSPIKCRYLKILGLERVNPSWGISIWEIEIYGPMSVNPSSTVTKEAYLSKGEDEDKKKEADALIKKLSAKVVPLSVNAFQKGVVYTSWMAEELSDPVSDFTLAHLKEIGIDTVAIMVPAYQKTLDSDTIFVNDEPDGDTPTMASLKHAAEVCHELGMRVMIKPHVDPLTDEARINIRPSEKWFDSYEKFIVKYAKFSQENNAEIYSIGTELEATTFEAWSHRWEKIIDEIKSVYKGTLLYSANWTEYKNVPFWDKIDLIGIDAYFPLTNGDEPSPEALADAWKNIADEIEQWRIYKGLTDKGVVFSEMGYPSANGANRQPWVAISNVEDQKEQADCLEAMFTVMTKRPWFKGYYIWQYFPQDRWSPLGFTVKDKEAEEVVKKWVKNPV